jgi:hypothetical protein
MRTNFSNISFQKQAVAKCSVVQNQKKIPCTIFELDSSIPEDSVYFSPLCGKSPWKNAFYLGSIGIRELTSTKAGGGGQRYGEILIYDHVLTDEERSSTEAYLAAKWWGEPMAGYTVDGKPNMPGQQSDSSVALTVPSEETLSGWRSLAGGDRGGKTGSRASARASRKA